MGWIPLRVGDGDQALKAIALVTEGFATGPDGTRRLKAGILHCIHAYLNIPAVAHDLLTGLDRGRRTIVPRSRIDPALQAVAVIAEGFTTGADERGRMMPNLFAGLDALELVVFVAEDLTTSLDHIAAGRRLRVVMVRLLLRGFNTAGFHLGLVGPQAAVVTIEIARTNADMILGGAEFGITRVRLRAAEAILIAIIQAIIAHA